MKFPFLLTGASGFVGQQLFLALDRETLRLGRSPANHIRCDLSIDVPELPPIDTVIHSAGKAHMVPKTPSEADAFFQVNEQGTRHLLQALEAHPPNQFIFISTVSVYGREEGQNIDESHPLNGATPYARSKIQAEAAVQTWCEARGVPWIILRLPLIAGPNPPGNLGAIQQAIAKGRYFRIAGNGARKSMVLAADVARLLPQLTGKTGIYNLTDGLHPTFAEIEDAIADALNQRITLRLPKGLVTALARAGDGLTGLGLPFPLTTNRLEKMTATLTFSDEKARRELGWRPRAVIAYIRGGGLQEGSKVP